MSENRVTAKKVLMEHIERDWSVLNRLLNHLSETQWLDVKNADGWATKDHIAHLTVWERSVIAFLSGRPRHEALQVAQELYLSGDFDAINLVIFQQHQHDPLEQVQARFQATHAELLHLIELLTDEDLNQPYAHYLPDEPGDGEGPPAINLIYGNTAHHYREHQVWIEESLDAASIN